MNFYRLCHKKYLCRLIYVFFILVCFENVYAADPKFQLLLTNRTYISSNEGYFDILIKHTNLYQTDFKYAGGQFIITLDTMFISDHLHYIYTKDTSTYGEDRIPLQYIGTLTKENDILKLDSGETILPGSEPVISHTNGTIIARIKFYNPDLYLSSCLTEDEFIWKTNLPGDYTMIYANTGGIKFLLNNNQNFFSSADLCQGTLCCLSAPLPPPLRISPENNSLNTSSPVTFVWEKGFPVNYFAQLQIAYDSSFANIVHNETITSPNGSGNISVIVSDLNSPGTYFWRVKQGGIPPAGAFNEPWKFTLSQPALTLNIKAIPEGLLGADDFEPFVIKAYLRKAVSPFNLIDSSEIISSDSSFTNTFTFNNAPTDKYYIVFHKPNCIETYSREGGDSLIRGSVINYYDFTSAITQAYGNNLYFAESLYCIYSGDINQDGLIDIIDLLDVLNHSNEFSSVNDSTDINEDGITDLNDMITLTISFHDTLL
jgi:hypothetical protein